MRSVDHFDLLLSPSNNILILLTHFLLPQSISSKVGQVISVYGQWQSDCEQDDNDNNKLHDIRIIYFLFTCYFNYFARLGLLIYYYELY